MKGSLIFLAVVWVVVLGIVAPALISARDSILTVTGFALIGALAFVTFRVVSRALRERMVEKTEGIGGKKPVDLTHKEKL